MKLNKRLQDAYNSDAKKAGKNDSAADESRRLSDGGKSKASKSLNKSALDALAAGASVSKTSSNAQASGRQLQRSAGNGSSKGSADGFVPGFPVSAVDGIGSNAGNAYGKGSSSSSASGTARGSALSAKKDSDSGFLKTGIEPSNFMKIITQAKPGQKPTLREIAGLLMLVGKDQASRILALLPDDLVEAISLEISKIKVLRPEESKQIIERFHIATIEEQNRLRGGRDFARDLLEKSVGKRKATEILEKTVSPVSVDQLEFLNDLEAGQLKQLLKDEPPRLVGIILSHLEKPLAAALLVDLPNEMKAPVIRTMGEKVKLSQEVLHSIAKALKGKIRRIGTQQSNFIDGPQILAEILRSMDASSERNLLEDLGVISPDVEAQIKERLFTIERVLHIRDTDLQKILSEMSDEDIALLMKGKDEEIRLRFLRNVSNQRSIAISEVYHYMGPIPRRDVDDSTRDFIIRLRKLEEAGDIVIQRDDEQIIY